MTTGVPPSVARELLRGLPVDVAPCLLGATLTTHAPDGDVTIRITEVEAYHGLGTGDRPDPGSHARMGRTARNATMWGDAGHAYVYLSHGIHACVNVVCGPEDIVGGVLLRAGEVIDGVALARVRRGTRVTDRDLARGPGRLGQALGMHHAVDDGIDLLGTDPLGGARATLRLLAEPVVDISTGPRVGVAGVAGTDAYPWRFWITGDRTVSAFRPGRGAAQEG